MKYIKHQNCEDAFIKIVGPIQIKNGIVKFKGRWMIQGMTSYWYAPDQDLENFKMSAEKAIEFKQYEPRFELK